MVTPMHSDECDDGMPPESKSGRHDQLRCLTYDVNTLSAWAAIHATKPALNTGFDHSAPNACGEGAAAAAAAAEADGRIPRVRNGPGDDPVAREARDRTGMRTRCARATRSLRTACSEAPIAKALEEEHCAPRSRSRLNLAHSRSACLHAAPSSDDEPPGCHAATLPRATWTPARAISSRRCARVLSSAI